MPSLNFKKQTNKRHELSGYVRRGEEYGGQKLATTLKEYKKEHNEYQIIFISYSIDYGADMKL